MAPLTDDKQSIPLGCSALRGDGGCLAADRPNVTMGLRLTAVCPSQELLLVFLLVMKVEEVEPATDRGG